MTTLVSRSITSTAPCPSFATMAYAPLVGQDGESPTSDLPDEASEIFLLPPIDPYLALICPSGKPGAVGRNLNLRVGGISSGNPGTAQLLLLRIARSEWLPAPTKIASANQGNMWHPAGF